jgi:hypothetical protein
MAIPNLTGATRYDTRGLPEGYDPHKFYEYRRDTLVKTATGIESFVYKYMPWSLTESFCFAIDPTYQFKVAPYAITPYNRERKRGNSSVLQNRSFYRRYYNWSDSQDSNYHGISVCWSPHYGERIEATFERTDELQKQPSILDHSDDTTKRTRLFGSEQGTARFFKSFIHSPPRMVDQNSTYTFHYYNEGPPSPECSEVGGANNTRAYSEEHKHYEVRGSAAVMYPHYVNTIRDREFLYCEQMIAKHGLAMLKEWNPTTKRDYTLFRNIVELKDIPRSIASLRKTAEALKLAYNGLPRNRSVREAIISLGPITKQIPNEYLSYNFGWRQTFKDIKDLLELPAKLGKKYDFLIRRAGKPTTFRSKRSFESSTIPSVAGFDYDTSPIEYGVAVDTRLERTTELRLVINATFDFPPPNPVRFNSIPFWDRIGAVPRPTDIYNLVPWTWLVDWFTGFGNYVEQIDNIARDTALINWGMITAHTDGKLVTTFKSKTDERATTTEDFVGSNEVLTTVNWNHTSQLVYECQIRKDVAALLDVNTTAAPKLSTYQQSIIGSILSQRGNIKRKPTRA